MKWESCKKQYGCATGVLVLLGKSEEVRKTHFQNENKLVRNLKTVKVPRKVHWMKDQNSHMTKLVSSQWN